MTCIVLKVQIEFKSELTCMGPTPAADKTPMLLIIKPRAQSDAIVCFNETFTCTQPSICA